LDPKAPSDVLNANNGVESNGRFFLKCAVIFSKDVLNFMVSTSQASASGGTQSNLKADVVEEESGIVSSIKNLHVSDTQRGKGNSALVMETHSLTDHRDNEPGTHPLLDLKCCLPVFTVVIDSRFMASHFVSDEHSSQWSTPPEQNSGNIGLSSGFEMGAFEAPMQVDYLHDAQAIPSVDGCHLRAESPGTQNSAYGSNEMLEEFQARNVIEHSVSKQVECHLADNIEVPVFISYILREKQEDGWPELNLGGNICTEVCKRWS
jgi:hypothetical protein